MQLTQTQRLRENQRAGFSITLALDALELPHSATFRRCLLTWGHRLELAVPYRRVGREPGYGLSYVKCTGALTETGLVLSAGCRTSLQCNWKTASDYESPDQDVVCCHRYRPPLMLQSSEYKAILSLRIKAHLGIHYTPPCQTRLGGPHHHDNRISFPDSHF